MMDSSSQHTEPLLAEELGEATGSSDCDLPTEPSKPKREARPTVQECLGVPEKEMTSNVELDVYNMFFISDLWSQPFFYSMAVFVTKMTLFIVLVIDLQDSATYPFESKKPGVEVKVIVMLAQFFLIPVAIVIQEELMVTFFVFGNLEYSPGIMKRHANAYIWKWYTAHFARAADGIMFLYINTFLMLQVVNMLAMFLNFAALMFFFSIDNVALKLCTDGYWTRSLQECASDVEEMRFAFRQKHKVGCLGFLGGRASILGVSAAYVILVGFWVKVHFIDP